MEGDAHGFNVVVIEPNDGAWTEKVWFAAERLRPSRRQSLGMRRSEP
jgi:hypothetical protein